MISTLAETIIWIAKERMNEKGKNKPKNINSAIVAVGLEVDQLLMDFMSDQK